MPSDVHGISTSPLDVFRVNQRNAECILLYKIGIVSVSFGEFSFTLKRFTVRRGFIGLIYADMQARLNPLRKFYHINAGLFRDWLTQKGITYITEACRQGYTGRNCPYMTYSLALKDHITLVTRAIVKLMTNHEVPEKRYLHFFKSFRSSQY